MKRTCVKRIAALLLTALLLLGGAALADVASVDGSSYLRDAPALWGDVIGGMPEGTSARYLDIAWDERGVPWYEVSYRGTIGWVSGMYTSLDGEESFHALYGDIAATDGDTNIRNDHYRSARSLGVLPKGKRANYLGLSDTDERGVVWYYVTYGDTTGWVSSRYTTRKGGSYSGDDWEEFSGWVTGSGGNSNIRSTPSLSGNEIGLLPDGASAEYLGNTRYDERGVAWYKIRYSGIIGWVSSRYTDLQ